MSHNSCPYVRMILLLTVLRRITSDAREHGQNLLTFVKRKMRKAKINLNLPTSENRFFD